MRAVATSRAKSCRMRVATLITCWCALAPAAAQTFRGLDDAELAAGPAAWAGYDDPFAPWLAEGEEEPSEGGLTTGAAP